MVTPDQNLIYSSAEYFKMKVFTKVLKQRSVSMVIINGEAISYIDTTAIIVSFVQIYSENSF